MFCKALHGKDFSMARQVCARRGGAGPGHALQCEARILARRGMEVPGLAAQNKATQ